MIFVVQYISYLEGPSKLKRQFVYFNLDNKSNINKI